MVPVSTEWLTNVTEAVHSPQTHRSHKSISPIRGPAPACYFASAGEPAFHLLFLKRAVYESAFQ
jgi:hypothetical protein